MSKIFDLRETIIGNIYIYICLFLSFFLPEANTKQIWIRTQNIKP